MEKKWKIHSLSPNGSKDFHLMSKSIVSGLQYGFQKVKIISGTALTAQYNSPPDFKTPNTYQLCLSPNRKCLSRTNMAVSGHLGAVWMFNVPVHLNWQNSKIHRSSDAGALFSLKGIDKFSVCHCLLKAAYVFCTAVLQCSPLCSCKQVQFFA